MVDIALEIPLGLFSLGRFLQRHNPRAAGVKVLAEAFDSATFSCGISAFEHHGDTGARGFDPGLQFHQLDLQRVHGLLIGLFLHPRGMRIVRIQYRLLSRIGDSLADVRRRAGLEIAADGAVKWQCHGQNLPVLNSL
jgi:hypothetical protein